MATSDLSDIELDDSTGVRWSKLQLWLRFACDQAGISYTVSGLLSDIQLEDSEGMRFAKLQRWLALLANNITGGGGGGTGAIQRNSVPLVPGQQAYNIVFNTPFASNPTFLPQPVVLMPNSSGEIFEVSYDLSTLTPSSVTAYLSGIPTAASSGGFIYWAAAL